MAAFARKGVKVEYVQTDNDFEFTNRFPKAKRNLPMLFEASASDLGVQHKPIRPYTPRHNGKVAPIPAPCALWSGFPQRKKQSLHRPRSLTNPQATISVFGICLAIISS